MSLDEGSSDPKLDQRRFWSRLTAVALLASGVIVGLIDAYASRAQGQTAAASSGSVTSAATNAPVSKSPALASALKNAVRNPSQIGGQIGGQISGQLPPPVTTSDRSSASASKAPSTKPKPNIAASIKKALPTAAVDWAQAVRISKRSQLKAQVNPIVARLPKLELDKTLLPVLLPKAGATFKATQASMVSFGSAYSLNLPQRAGLNIILYGHRTLAPADKGGVANLARTKISGVAEDIFMSQTEDGWTASFKRFGVVYTVDVSCDDLEAPECKTDGYIRAAVADLGEVSLGASAQKEALSAGVKP